MKDPNFARGLNDVRTGKRFDWTIDDWSYERGRLLGRIAPATMPLFVGGKLNPTMLKVYSLASERGWIP
jgi:hypothetical protein